MLRRLAVRFWERGGSDRTRSGALARYLGEAGQPGEAVDRFRDLLPDLLRVLGPDHPATRKGQRRHKRGNRYIGAVTGETAVAAGKTDTREGARHRRISRRRGKAKACVATGNTQMRVFHVLLPNPGMRYEDLGTDWYHNQQQHARKVGRLVGAPDAMGYDVTLCRKPGSGTEAAPAA
jgi:hypothetical protein